MHGRFEVMRLLTLLDETDQRRIGILEVLIQQSGWITIGEIACIVGASERTIHSDLNYIKSKWNDQLQLEVSLKNGIQLGCHSAVTLHEIQMDVFKQSTASCFLHDLFLFPHQGIEFFSKRLFVSKSTLIRMIPKINAYLSTMNIEIEYRGALYCLAASDEQELRKLLSALYIELNPQLTLTPDAPMNILVPGATEPINFARLNHIVFEMLQQSSNHAAIDLVLNDASALPQMIAFYFVSLIRENQAFHIASARPLGNEISLEDLQYLIRLFPAVSRESIQPIHSLLMKPFLSSDDSGLDQLDTEANAFYERVFQALHVSCPQKTKEQLVQTMKILYHYALICPASFTGFIRRINGFVSSLQDCHPVLYDAFENSLALFSDAMKVNLQPALPDLILRSCFLFPAFGIASPARRVFVVSDSGIEHAKFIASNIRSFFNGEYYETVQVSPVPYADVQNSSFSSGLAKEDILITTTPDLLCLLPNQRIILFQDFPSVENFGLLHDAIYHK